MGLLWLQELFGPLSMKGTQSTRLAALAPLLSRHAVPVTIRLMY